MSWLGSLAGSIGGGLSGLLGKASGLLSNPAVNVAAHLTGAGALTDMINGANAIVSKVSGSGGGYSNLEKLAILNALQNNGGSTEADPDKDASKAADIAAEQSQQQAKASETAGVNAGLGKARAAAVGSGSSDKTYANALNNNRNAMASQAASTQADYMEKLGQGLAMHNQADNLGKSARYAGISGALQGGAAGMSMGATISDENAKQDPIDDDKLLKAIEEFKMLKSRVDGLKKRAKC